MALAALTTAVLSVGVVVVGIASPASAAPVALSAAASCSTSSHWTITWTLNNADYSNEQVTASSDTALIPLGTTVAAGATQTFTETVTAPVDKTVTLTTTAVGGSYPTTYNISGSITTSQFVGSCTAPVTTPPSAPAACIPDSAVSYVYDSTNNSGSVTVAPVAGSTGVLCHTLYITATSWSFTNSNSQWPQTLASSTQQTITTPGTYAFSAPVTCGQGDIYASTTSPIIPTSVLGGRESWETFLSDLGYATTSTGRTYTLQSLNCYGQVTPVAPTVTPAATCGARGTVVPAVTTGVDYAVVINSNTGAYTVTATPAAGYHFAGNAPSTTFTGTVASPTNCSVGSAGGEAVIAVGQCIYNQSGTPGTRAVEFEFHNTSSQSVTFTVSGHPELDTVVPAGQTVTVPAGSVASSGATYTVTAGSNSFLFTVPACSTTPSQPTSPPSVRSTTVSQGAPNCSTSSVLVTTTVTNTTWVYDSSSNSWVSGAPSISTTTTTRPLTAGESYACLSPSGGVAPSVPTVAQATCVPSSSLGGTATLVSGYISVTPVSGIAYTIHPVASGSSTANDIAVTSQRTNVAAGSYVVTAHALYGSSIAYGSATSWPITVSSIVCQQLPSHALAGGGATASDQSCGVNGGVSSGSITVDLSGGLDYFVNGVQLVSATTAFAPGTYTVTGVPQAGFSWSGPPWTVVIAAVSTACGELSTLALHDYGVEDISGVADVAGASDLAYTGFDGGGIYLTISGALLLIGATLVIWSRRKARA